MFMLQLSLEKGLNRIRIPIHPAQTSIPYRVIPADIHSQYFRRCYDDSFSSVPELKK